jgi:hypothetical protein
MNILGDIFGLFATEVQNGNSNLSDKEVYEVGVAWSWLPELVL